MKKIPALAPLFSIALLFASCQKDMSNVAEQTARGSVRGSQLTDCGTLRTQTPGGWGSKPSGNNPGAYLHSHFNDAFSGELIVGCGDNYVRLTSAQAVTNLLPTGGKAGVLTGAYTNPSSMKNVLVGHLVALKLSAVFDEFDVNFAPGEATLGNRIISSGPFAGWNVWSFIAEADNVLGGCSTMYTPTQVLETATLINQNYVDGTVNHGYLVCPDGGSDDGGTTD